jgi:hypothetical protein
MYDNPYNNKALPFIWRIIVLSLVIALGCIGDKIFLTFLVKSAKNNTYTKSTLVNV